MGWSRAFLVSGPAAPSGVPAGERLRPNSPLGEEVGQTLYAFYRLLIRFKEYLKAHV